MPQNAAQFYMSASSSAVDLDAFRAFLAAKGKSATNIESILRVVKKLVTGAGVEHKSKPGEIFKGGEAITLVNDLYRLQAEADEWLPYKKNDPRGCMDKGHGWALNHPIVNLRDFQEHIRSGAPPLPPPPPASASSGKSCAWDDDDDDDDDDHSIAATPASCPTSGPASGTTTTPVKQGSAAKQALQPSRPPAKRTYGDDVLGAQVEVEFDGVAWHTGTINEYRASVLEGGGISREHYVVFADGDEYWYDLAADEQMGLMRWPGGAKTTTGRAPVCDQASENFSRR